MNEKTNDILFGLYMGGFQQGQLSMIETMESLGLVNGKMAELLIGTITGDPKLDEPFDRETADNEIENAYRELIETML